MKHRTIHHLSAALLAAALATGCVDDSPDKHLAAAKAYLGKKDYKAAAIEVKSALQKDPDLGEARFLLGSALMKDGDPVAAEVEFRKALDAKYQPNLVVPELARTLLATGKAKALVDEYSGTHLEPAAADASLKTSLSVAYGLLGKPDQAKAELDAALQVDPQNSSALLLSAVRKAGAQDTNGALALVEAVISRDPSNVDAWQLKGDLLLQGRRQPELALAAYRKAIEISPRLVPAQVAAATVLIDQGKLDEAERQLADLRKVAPRTPQALFAETLLAYQKKDYLRARTLSLQLQQFGSTNARVLQLAGATEFQLGALAQAEVLLARAVQVAPDLQGARRMLIATYLRSGQSAKALSELNVAAGKEGLDPALYALAGEVYLQNGDAKLAEEYFSKALKLDPNNTGKRTALALTHLASGRAAALDELQNIAGSDVGVSADLALISAHLRKGEFDKALAAIDKLEAKQPDKPLAANLRGRVQLARKDNAAARKSFERSLAIDPNFYAAVASLAALDTTEGKPEDAGKRYDEFIARNPKHAQALLGAAQLAALQGRGKDEVAKLLGKAVDANPNDMAPRLLLIDLYLRLNDPKQALTAAQAGVAAIPNNADMLDALGRAQQATGELNQAIATFGKVVALQPLSPLGYIRLAEAQAASHDDAGAEASLRRALEVKPDFVDAQRRLIALNLNKKSFGEAARIARMVREQRPSEATGYLLEGEVAMAQRKFDAAAEAYRAGLQRAPSSEIASRLHTLLLLSGKPPEAEKFGVSWVKEHPRDAGFLAYLGDLAVAQKDYASAERAYVAALQIQPNNAAMLNNVAWTMGQQHKDGAVGYAEKANQLAPAQPLFMDTLAMLYADKGETAKAIELLKKAVDLQPSQAGIRLNLAKVYVQSGAKDKAKAELETLAKLGAAFGGQAQVTEMLKSL